MAINPKNLRSVRTQPLSFSCSPRAAKWTSYGTGLSRAKHLLLPVINEYAKLLFFFAHNYVKCVVLTTCNGSKSHNFSLASSNDPTFFPEIFPIETWTGANQVAVLRGISEDEVPDRAREQEALVALSAAQSSRQSGNIKRAKMIIEHAMALAPNHPDILTEYGLFHEMLEDNVLEADLCYAKALA
ncbi:hypothetical protein OSTOST_03034 [Ostertagia ostertagi]